MKHVTKFQNKVYEIVKKIPRGKVMSYKEVAEKIGKPRAYRAVGNALNKSASWRTDIPCHRVVRSDGSPGGYRKGIKKKVKLLKNEKVF